MVVLTKECLLKYISDRKADIRDEQKRIKNYSPKQREMVRRQLRGRMFEIERLRKIIE